MRIIPYHQELQGQGSMSEILLYGLIEVLSFKEGHCYASNQYLAENLDMAKGTLANTLSRIAKRGWVVIEFDEQNHRTAIKPNLTIVPLTKELTPSSQNNEHPLNNSVNIYKKKDIKEDNITNKLVIGETPNEKVVYGKEEINEVLDLWQKYIGYPLKDSKYNRYAVNNFLRAKDKGIEWVKKMLALLKEAQKDKYSGIHIANYVDLQRDYEKLLAWGSAKYQQRQEESSIIGDIPF